MGHSINPTSFRLYFSKYWNSNWYTLGNYSYFLIKNLQLNEYFYSFFHKNKRNRIFFYKKFMYDSLSIHKKINRFFITLNVFDFRIKTYKNISHSTKFYSPVPQNGIRIEYEDLRFKSRKKLTRFLLKKYKIKFNKMPWLYKRYIMKLYFNLNVTNTLLKKKKYLTFFGNKLYSKKFFFAYLIYMKQFNYRLNYSNILNLPLKNFIFDILTNYYKFLNNSKNSNLLASSDMYNKKNFNNKSLLNIEYTNISRIKDKIKLIKQKNNFNVLNKKTKKFKKFFLFNLRNLIFTKNLILKYKNLLFLINKRIDLFKNKYNLIFINKKKLIQNKKIRKFNLLSNLYWRRDRLIALIFFLRKRSKIAKLKFKNEIFLLKNQIIKLKEISNLNNVEESQMNILFNNAKEKVYQLLAQKLIFLNLFNSINVLNKNFLVYNYLNLLDKSKLLRFNLRFALYKQAYLNFISKTNTKNLYKINIDKNITNIRKLRYSIALLKKKKLKNRRISSFSFNREFTTSLFKSIKFNKLILYKIKNFRNVFNLKLAKINVRSVLNKYKLKKKENQFINKLNLNTISTNLTFDRLSDVNKLIDIQIDSVKSYERKKLVLLKKNKTNNYKYFLKFIALKNIYNFNNSNNKSINLNNYSFKFLLKSVIKDLKKKNYNKLTIVSYLKKKYVYLLFRKFLRKKYYKNIFFKKNALFKNNISKYKLKRLSYNKLLKRNQSYNKGTNNKLYISNLKTLNLGTFKHIQKKLSIREFKRILTKKKKKLRWSWTYSYKPKGYIKNYKLKKKKEIQSQWRKSMINFNSKLSFKFYKNSTKNLNSNLFLSLKNKNHTMLSLRLKRKINKVLGFKLSKKMGFFKSWSFFKKINLYSYKLKNTPLLPRFFLLKKKYKYITNQNVKVYKNPFNLQLNRLINNIAINKNEIKYSVLINKNNNKNFLFLKKIIKTKVDMNRLNRIINLRRKFTLKDSVYKFIDNKYNFKLTPTLLKKSNVIFHLSKKGNILLNSSIINMKNNRSSKFSSNFLNIPYTKSLLRNNYVKSKVLKYTWLNILKISKYRNKNFIISNIKFINNFTRKNINSILFRRKNSKINFLSNIIFSNLKKNNIKLTNKVAFKLMKFLKFKNKVIFTHKIKLLNKILKNNKISKIKQNKIKTYLLILKNIEDLKKKANLARDRLWLRIRRINKRRKLKNRKLLKYVGKLSPKKLNKILNKKINLEILSSKRLSKLKRKSINKEFYLKRRNYLKKSRNNKNKSFSKIVKYRKFKFIKRSTSKRGLKLEMKKQLNYIIKYGHVIKNRLYKKIKASTNLMINHNYTIFKLYMLKYNKASYFAKSVITNKYKVVPSYLITLINKVEKRKLRRQQINKLLKEIRRNKNFSRFNLKYDRDIQAKLSINYKNAIKRSTKSFYIKTVRKKKIKKFKKLRFNSNFIRKAIFFDLKKNIYSKNFKKFLFEYYQIKSINLNMKRIAHANIYSWNKNSFLIYKQNSYSNLNLKDYNYYNHLNNLFVKKKLFNSKINNTKYFNFYKLLNLFILKKRYNFFFNLNNKFLNNKNNVIFNLNKINAHIYKLNFLNINKKFNYFLWKNVKFFCKSKYSLFKILRNKRNNISRTIYYNKYNKSKLQDLSYNKLRYIYFTFKWNKLIQNINNANFTNLNIKNKIFNIYNFNMRISHKNLKKNKKVKLFLRNLFMLSRKRLNNSAKCLYRNNINLNNINLLNRNFFSKTNQNLNYLVSNKSKNINLSKFIKLSKNLILFSKKKLTRKLHYFKSNLINFNNLVIYRTKLNLIKNNKVKLIKNRILLNKFKRYTLFHFFKINNAKLYKEYKSKFKNSNLYPYKVNINQNKLDLFVHSMLYLKKYRNKVKYKKSYLAIAINNKMILNYKLKRKNLYVNPKWELESNVREDLLDLIKGKINALKSKSQFKSKSNYNYTYFVLKKNGFLKVKNLKNILRTSAYNKRYIAIENFYFKYNSNINTNNNNNINTKLTSKFKISNNINKKKNLIKYTRKNRNNLIYRKKFNYSLTKIKFKNKKNYFFFINKIYKTRRKVSRFLWFNYFFNHQLNTKKLKFLSFYKKYYKNVKNYSLLSFKLKKINQIKLNVKDNKILLINSRNFLHNNNIIISLKRKNTRFLLKKTINFKFHGYNKNLLNLNLKYKNYAKNIFSNLYNYKLKKLHLKLKFNRILRKRFVNKFIYKLSYLYNHYKFFSLPNRELRIKKYFNKLQYKHTLINKRNILIKNNNDIKTFSIIKFNNKFSYNSKIKYPSKNLIFNLLKNSFNLKRYSIFKFSKFTHLNLNNRITNGYNGYSLANNSILFINKYKNFRTLNFYLKFGDKFKFLPNKSHQYDTNLSFFYKTNRNTKLKNYNTNKNNWLLFLNYSLKNKMKFNENLLNNKFSLISKINKINYNYNNNKYNFINQFKSNNLVTKVSNLRYKFSKKKLNQTHLSFFFNKNTYSNQIKYQKNPKLIELLIKRTKILQYFNKNYISNFYNKYNQLNYYMKILKNQNTNLNKNKLFNNLLRINKHKNMERSNNIYHKLLNYKFSITKKNIEYSIANNLRFKTKQFVLKSKNLKQIKKNLLLNNIFSVNKSDNLNKFKKNYIKVKNVINLHAKLKVQKYTTSWLYYKKKNNKINNLLILRKKFNNNNFINELNRLFFIKLMSKLGFSFNFSKAFLLKFNRKLFIFIIKYLLIKKAILINNKSFLKITNLHNSNSLYSKSLLIKNIRYTKINNFIYQNYSNLNSIIINDKNKFILNEKFNTIKLSTKNTDLNYSNIKINLFSLYLNLLLKYKLKVKTDKEQLRSLLLAYKFQKFLWLKNKKYKFSLYNLKFKKNINKLNNNKKVNYYLLKKQKLNWKKQTIRFFFNKFKKVEDLFIRLKAKKFKNNTELLAKLTKFRIKLKLKFLGLSYYYLSFFLKWHLTRLFFKNDLNSIYIRFNIITEPSAFYISKYICNYLKKGLKLHKIVNSLIYKLSKLYPNIGAIQVKCVGRHTRKERANKDWFRQGALRLSNINSKIDYASNGVVLQYGYTNVKVWLLKLDKNKDKLELPTSFV